MSCRRGIARVLGRLYSTGKQTSSKRSTGGGDATGVKEPAIALNVGDATVGSPYTSKVSTPVSYYLDTHSAVMELQRAGFEPERAEVIIRVMTQSLQSAVSPIERSILSQRDLDLMELRMMKELESLKNENITLRNTVEKLTSGYKEEVTKVQSNLQLDLNLEKGRIKEETTVQRQDIRDTNNRIDKEVAQIRTQIEAQKLESVKYLAGVSFSVVTIVLSVSLGVWRLMK